MDVVKLLKWQVEMGADEALEEKSVDRVERYREDMAAKVKQAEQVKNTANIAAVSAVKNPAPASPAPSFTSNPIEAEKRARAWADKCRTLAELRDAVSNFDGLAIRKTAENTVFCDGNPDAKIMFIGEAPGANEDKQGIPFCGASGQLMDEILKWAGFTRAENIYISNTVFWRPPGNRRPTPEELAICRPFVEKHIALVAPEILVLVGGTATFSLLGTKTGITRLRGKFHDYENGYLSQKIPAMALFHPSFLLRQPTQKETFWFDILTMKRYLEEKGVASGS